MEDSVDRHLARWRGKGPYDERVEGVVTRMQLLVKHLRQAKEASMAEVGLQEFEFQTLHLLAARDDRRATPTELASQLLLSPAGMTGRLDTLERAGLVRRIRGSGDRRRVDVEMTERGHDLWMEAMVIQARVETGLVGVLSPAERETLDALLKRLLLKAEAEAEAGR
ncbi:MarR family winged helix-turn-helix transcriptional regulator [Bailinhaonella thermotolerans]|uniref:MarR family transcriptional regulator n=1 Tax=Bailinhaonella thermotolerans TaxID=1070861 RepID=A0A3A4BH14_9ACTN|nr:MarR family transcriptional regulator [Bailinhaonella thermotolerans]RJL34052.1 MarR family transcriptional regulator [Bailinhaonella thermotolerans]